MTSVKFIIKSIKGFVKPGHKYIRRTGVQGKYVYVYDDMDVKKTPVKTKPKKTSTKAQSTAKEVLAALKYLSDQCNYASTLDGCGYNKFDANFGHDLSSRDSLTEGMRIAALKMLKKYNRQLNVGGITLNFQIPDEDDEILSVGGESLKYDADADILLTPYDANEYAILFDFSYNDPKWRELKDAIKSVGARYDGTRRIWHIDDESLPQLFDKVKSIAVSEDAKKMIANKNVRIEKKKVNKQKEIKTKWNEKKKQATKEEQDQRLTEQNMLKLIKRRIAENPSNARLANKLWIDDKGVARVDSRKKGESRFKNPNKIHAYLDAVGYIALTGHLPGTYTLKNITQQAQQYMRDKITKSANKELDESIFLKPIDKITDTDILKIIVYGKKSNMLREGTRGDKKGKICLDKKYANRWDHVSEIDRHVRNIFDHIKGWDSSALATMGKVTKHWFVDGDPKKGLSKYYLSTDRYLAWKVGDILDDYNHGKGSTNVKQIFGTTGTGTIKEQLKTIAKASKEIVGLKKKTMKAFEDSSEIEIPGLKKGIKLWSHQNKYLHWMLAVDKGVVGADTGLGKTFITLAYLKKMKADKKIDGGLLFLPGAVMYSWEPELKKRFSGKAKVLYIDGTIREKKAAIKRLQKEKFDLVVCSHGLVGGSEKGTQYPLFKKVMANTKNYALIYDEAHKGLLKQSNNAWKNLHELAKQKHQFLLTATPARNEPADVKNLIDLLHPGILGSTKSFNLEYTKKVGNVRVPKNQEQMWEGLKHLSPVISKYSPDVDIKLPKAVFTTEQLRAGTDQEEYVEAAQKAAIQALLKVQDPDHLTKQESSHIFAVLGNMRKLIFDPRMIYEKYTGSSAMIDRTIELIGDKMLHPDVVGKKQGASIIVSSFVKPFPAYKEMLKKRLGLKESEISVITGNVDKKLRPQIENNVNSGKTKVLMMGIGSGGVGLNFQKGADSVFVISDPWTFADKKQAVDRIIRPGAGFDRMFITDYAFHGAEMASTGISQFVRGKVETKRKMHEAADVEGKERELKETSSFDDFMSALGITQDQYNKLRKQQGVQKSIKYVIKSRML